MASSVVETELFPRGALEFYTKKNMGWQYSQEESDQWLLPERGGEQGDYRDGMQEKIANVVDCLRSEPRSLPSCLQFKLSGPLKRDRRQCSCDTPLYRDTFQEAT